MGVKAVKADGSGKKRHSSKRLSKKFRCRKRREQKKIKESGCTTERMNNLWNKEINDLFQKNDASNYNDSIMEENVKDSTIDGEMTENPLQMKHVSLDMKSNISEWTNENSSPFSFFMLFQWFLLIICFLFITIFKSFVNRQSSLISNRLNIYKQKLHYMKVGRRILRNKFRKFQQQKKKVEKKKRKKINKPRIQCEIKKIEDCTKLPMDGRRIVDFNYVWQELSRNLGCHGTKCLFKDWIFVRELNMIGGLRTLFCFKCRRCNKECRIWSEPTNDKIMDINQSAVLGTLHEGLGYTNVNGLFASLNIPFMNEKTFKTHQEKLLHHLKIISADSMKKAGEEETRLAKEAGDILQGIPFITVVVDGSWIKRCFGSKYDSLSGLGAIVGKRTGKVLYVGIKNKYCAKCQSAKSVGKEPLKHDCNQNYSYNKPSSLMETEALLEGFKESLSVHNIIYRFFVGDGDSNFYKRLLDANPYASLNIIPRKIECTNHLLRNLCKKTDTLAKTTQKKGERKKGFVQIRNIVKDSILKMRQTVIDEVDKQLSDEKKTWSDKIQDLQKCILNIPNHIFGDHRRCKTHGFSHCDTAKTNYIPYLKVFGFYEKIQEYVKILSCHSESLLHKMTNNIVESFNSLVCKVVSGKRINYACSNQYNTRVAISILQHNSQKALVNIFEGMKKYVPTAVETLINNRISKIKRTKEYRALIGRKRKHAYTINDKNYGINCEKPDLEEGQVRLLYDEHFKSLKEDQRNRLDIEEKTRGQSNCDEWELKRRKLLTASNFGRICRMRPQTSCAAMVKTLLYPQIKDTVAMAFGRENEEISRKELEQMIKKDIKSCGLFIHPTDPRFAASPDGLIDDDGLVELKNPLRAKDLTAEEAVKTFPDLNFIDGKTNSVKKTHHWYYQIQGQLQATQREYGIIALRTPKSIIMRKVTRDDEFWKTHMEPHLSKFYDNCLLPEIIDSRYQRNMNIREPLYIQEARLRNNEKSQKKKRKIASKETNSENVLEEIINIETQNITNKEPLEEDREKEDCDLQITSVSYDERIWTAKDIETYVRHFDREVILNEELKNIILTDAWLNEDAIDAFLNVAKKHTQFEIQSVMYMYSPVAVKPVETNNSVGIIGGEATNHWRTLHYDGNKIYIYDSIRNYKGGKLVKKEMDYVLRRFPNINKKDIVFPKMKCHQPDGSSCGVYAAAIVTYIILTGEPSTVNFTRNTNAMRRHLFNIIKNGKLINFPTDE